MRLFFIILCAFCFSISFSCSKKSGGKTDGTEDLPKDSAAIVDSAAKVDSVLKTDKIEVSLKGVDQDKIEKAIKKEVEKKK